MLIEDGLWRTWRSRLALYGVLMRIFARLIPRLLRILKPSYDPRKVPDPPWVTAWWRMHREDGETLGDLDTARLAAPFPVPRLA